MKQSVPLFFLLFLVSSIVEAFQVRAKVDKQLSKTVHFSTVYTNHDYIPPLVPTAAESTSSNANSVDQHNQQMFQGGHLFMEIGHSIRQAGAERCIDEIESRLLLQEAGDAIQEIGVAWQAANWEAVAYCALDASQTMELVAQSLNHHKKYPTNELQKAYAGVAVELKVLSRKEEPESINLQGLSLRLYQASRGALDDPTTRRLEQASQAAQSLAKTYGATSSFLPRRWRLWWHSVSMISVRRNISSTKASNSVVQPGLS